MKFQCMLALLLAVAVAGASAKTHHDAVASAVVADLSESVEGGGGARFSAAGSPPPKPRAHPPLYS